MIDAPAAPPLVSIVIPCYNHAAYLGAAIESALRQTWPAVEVVVVDDGSTDGSAAVAAQYPGVRLLQGPNRGVGHARNAGLAASRGDIVIFLDADDLLRPGAAAAGVTALAHHPDAMLVFGRCEPIDASGAPKPATILPLAGDSYAALLRRNPIWTPAMAAFRRAVFGLVGPFATDCDPSADYDMYLRVAWRYPLAEHEEVVAAYRQHGANMSARPDIMLNATLTVLRRQRPLVRGRRDLGRAYHEGERAWRAFYGEQMVERFRTALHGPGGWRAAWPWVIRLLRAYPRGVLRHLGRKIRMMLPGTDTRRPAGRADQTAQR